MKAWGPCDLTGPALLYLFSVQSCVCRSLHLRFECSIRRGRNVTYREVLWARVRMAVGVYLGEEKPRGA